MNTSGIIITGSTGYLGCQLLKKLDKERTLLVNRDSISNDNIRYFDIDKKEIDLTRRVFNDYVLIHMATHFSKDHNDKKDIIKSNIEFGQRLLKHVNRLNLKKIIYTNTMFNYYDNVEIRELDYTKSKAFFSEEVNDYALKNSIMFDEIYLDNTFGGVDKRKKIIPIIVESILNGESSPILNAENSINLIHYSDAVQRIFKSIDSKISGKSSFVNNNSINLASIYDYLFNFYKTKKIDKNKLIFKNNDYLLDHPGIKHHDIELLDISNELLNLFNDS